MPSYFPDTNFFFECQKGSNLPWHELQDSRPEDAMPVQLIVPSQVVIEIERHKAKGNSRTSKRARDASAALRKALTSQDHSTVVRNQNPHVVLKLPPVVKIDFKNYPTLMEDRADHRILAEYAELAKTENDLTLLTDDTLLVIAARSLGFTPILIPDHWKLAPEKDERDDEIERLRDEVKVYKKTAPIIDLSFFDKIEVDCNSYKVEIKSFDPSDVDIKEALRLTKIANPICSDFDAKRPATNNFAQLVALGSHWIPPREDKIKNYIETEYPEWVSKVEKWLKFLPSKLNDYAHEFSFGLKLRNSGFVNATDLQVLIDGYDGILLLDELDEDDIEDREKSLKPPAAPKPPKGHYFSHFNTPLFHPNASIPDLGLLREPRRDPNSFYFVDGRPRFPREKLKLTCQAFPHQNQPYDLNFRAIISQDALGPKPRLRVRIEASNLRQPVEKFIRIEADKNSGNFLNKFSEIIG